MESRTTLLALTVISATLATVGVAAADAGPGYGWSGEHPMMWSGMFMGPVMMILVVVIIAVAIVVVLRMFGFGAHTSSPGTHDSSIAILNERFAKGEIDKVEYEERKRSLAG
ncbi:MAG: SHOCT domain-containing protein [Rhodospirillales bacterium]|nr:SHOCT domain-containing protein [Rhodospirillales bacterium]